MTPIIYKLLVINIIINYDALLIYWIKREVYDTIGRHVFILYELSKSIINNTLINADYQYMAITKKILKSCERYIM